MMWLANVTGLAGNALLITAALACFVPTRWAANAKLTALLLAFAASWIPLSELSTAGYLRGAVGDISITTLTLLVGAVLRRVGVAIRSDDDWWGAAGKRAIWLGVIALIAAIFYSMVLGATEFDPYRVGYGSPAMVAAVVIVAVIAWWFGTLSIAIACAAALLAWRVGIYESTNLWDYVLDPLLAIYAVFAVVRYAASSLRRQSRTS